MRRACRWKQNGRPCKESMGEIRPSKSVGNEDLGAKPGEDESVGRRGAPQVEVHELELK